MLYSFTKNDSIVYFRVPGDQVSCAYNIVLDGIINLDVNLSGVEMVSPSRYFGEFLLLETSLGTITGNFTKIISNVPVVLHVNKRNVTVLVNTTFDTNFILTFTSSIVIIVSSIIIFLLVMFIIWYKITTSGNHKITKINSTNNHKITSTKNRDKISEILGPPPKMKYMKYSRNPLMFDNL